MASRLKWSDEQQEELRNLKEKAEIESWKEIAERLNERFPDTNRSGKQCRERYINYVRFTQAQSKSTEWSSEDDSQFMKLYFEHGARWATIVKFMPQKSENCLKNRFYGGLRRLIRKINKVEKDHKLRKSKPLRYETLLRLLDYQASCEQTKQENEINDSEMQEFLLNLKRNILQSTWDLLNGKEKDESIKELILNVHLFNVRSKNMSTKKKSQDSSNQEGKKTMEQSVAMSFSTQASLGRASSFIETDEADNLQPLLLAFKKATRGISQIQENIISPEMRSYFAKGEKTNNSEELDKVMCSIMNQNFKPASFFLFG